MASNKQSDDLSRRHFLGVTIGTALAAGTGCGSDPKAETGTAAGGASPSEKGGATGQGGSAATTQGGSSASQSSTTANAQGGSSTGQGGSAVGAGGASSSTATKGIGGAPSATGGRASVATSTPVNPGGSSNTAAQNRGGAGGKSAAAGAPGTGGAQPSRAGAPARGGSPGASGSPAKAGASANGGTSSAAGTGAGGGSGSGDIPLVAMVRGTDWVQATMDAIEMAGGLPDLSGKTVLLKPNIISGDKDATTSVEVIHGVVKAAKAKNAKRIIVADAAWGSSTGSGVSSDVIANMKNLGITAMCTTEGAETLDLRVDPHTTRRHADMSAFPDGIDFSDTVYNADYVINVPVCKCHAMGKYTMALKAWYGCTENGRPHGNTWVAPAELHLLKREDFIVLDATKAMITGGPSSGTMAQPKIVVASKDAVALDVTGLCIHKYVGGTVIANKGDAWKVHQVKRALALKSLGWLTTPQAFSYAQVGVTEHAEIMALCMA